MIRSSIAPTLLALLLACGSADVHSQGAAETPEPIGDAECGSCGMIVHEQLSPRAQIVHRDGTHVWFCSVADLTAYLGAPSPHGHVEQIWVETLPADFSLDSSDVSERPWASAASATYVLGVTRMVMGTPVLAFANEADARAVAERVHGRVASWDETTSALGQSPGPH